MEKRFTKRIDARNSIQYHSPNIQKACADVVKYKLITHNAEQNAKRIAERKNREREEEYNRAILRVSGIYRNIKADEFAKFFYKAISKNCHEYEQQNKTDKRQMKCNYCKYIGNYVNFSNHLRSQHYKEFLNSSDRTNPQNRKHEHHGSYI